MSDPNQTFPLKTEESRPEPTGPLDTGGEVAVRTDTAAPELPPALPDQAAGPDQPGAGATANGASAPEANTDGKKLFGGREWTTSAQSLTITVVIAIFVITFIVQAFRIPSESMEKTLLVGDYLLVDKAHYGPPGLLGFLLPYSPIRRGDIVVFRPPMRPVEHYVKRVIGLPGDRVRLLRKRVYINGAPLTEPYAISHRGSDTFRDDFPAGDALSAGVSTRWYLQMRKLVENGQLVIPPGSYFVLGDNRDDSSDSRYWGLVPRENIVGRPLLIYWSLESAADAQPDRSQARDDKLSLLRTLLEQFPHGIRWQRILSPVQ